MKHGKTAIALVLILLTGAGSCAGQDQPGRYRSSRGIDFVLVPAGTFPMGSDDAALDAQPRHAVTLTQDFYIATTEVTFTLYDAFTQETGARKASDFRYGRENRPAVDMVWLDAIRFCNWLSQKDGLQPAYQIQGERVAWLRNSTGYRLPTEAEWEYAAQGGSLLEAFRFAGSDKPDDVAWFRDNSGLKNHPVGLKQPNGLGLFDMSGNVSEYCWDWVHPYEADGKPVTDPVGPESGTLKAVRGGSQVTPALTLPIWRRAAAVPASRYGDRGFRVVRSATKVN